MTDLDPQPSAVADHAGATQEGVPASAAEALEAERSFLLRSIEDLDAEHAAGELTDARHRELRDGYVVQAAAVLRALRRVPRDSRGEPAPRRGATRRHGGRRRRWVAATVVALAALGGGGALLVRSLAERAPGGTITGNAQSQAPDLPALATIARERPGDPRAQRDHARALLDDGQTLEALKAFDAAAALDPRDAESRAYGGWIIFLGGLTDEALVRLDGAVALDPSFPDARFFRGMALLRGRDDRTGALEDLRAFVRLAPPGPQRDEVQEVIDRLADPPAELDGSSTPRGRS